MICASALSTSRNTDAAFGDVLDRVAAGLGSASPRLSVAFVSAHHADALGRLASMVRDRFPDVHFLGVTGETIVGEGQEIEGATAVSLWAIALPEHVEARPVRISWTEDGFAGSVLPKHDENKAENGANTLLLFVDPFSFPIEPLLKMLETHDLQMRVVGGMASASNIADGNRLALDDEVYHDGAVGIWLDGPLTIRTVVSQGCRPIGRPMIITRVEENTIKELGRRPALEVLRETFETLDAGDQALIREGLHVGLVINEYQESFGRGDFLIRNVMGADNQGGIAITNTVRVGQTVQFHVRDARTADEDLRTLLAESVAGHPAARPAGGLLFSCNGRGSRLFKTPDHDASAIVEALGSIPIAGFFAMGELGPIGGKNFVHGFTASLAIFEAEDA